MKNFFVTIMIFYLSAFAICQEYEFTVYPYMKDGYHDEYYSVYKYIFENDSLSSIQITEYFRGNTKQKIIYIKRYQNDTKVFSDKNELLLNCNIQSNTDLCISLAGEDGDFFVSAKNGIIYAGLELETEERFFRIQKKVKKDLAFFFRRNDKPINNDIFSDFNVDLANESSIIFLESNGYYRKKSKDVFEYTFDDTAGYPVMKCSIKKSVDKYRFELVDIFIDYFCGSGMSYPIIWGQLITNSSNNIL